ncbi:MAG: hypothetical protein EOR30_17800 [Mesorhizobium sp.]|uniref:hypothetical protein n=1 Tax=unclassified Mesorhizobium TaxID=325217 RepID=UPI000FCC22E0|nr:MULTISPECIES: hypothetical protein [unclassified Mesorhizobium]RUV73207.1 hypothetical protein EOA78_12410 [Mesorhizobium sp. M5C.F.Cr.IN.023.01.1.1]RWF86630.1 MAG: hypothetical protein EOQ36_16335 [Mesorhizobium sp.]RWF95409.1 MAG: hypothetical protein EOQ45_08865 [Mesorhizobium sp.]RWI39753.1 MAG: hypothetical protein EOR14_16785 [Mesorhizobium sp.]RWI45380.1 MAG: hypothetical protein EOR15_23255 [Mesorhizobium sp.]
MEFDLEQTRSPSSWYVQLFRRLRCVKRRIGSLDWKAAQLRVIRTWKGSPAFDVPRWLVLLIAIVFSASTILHAGGRADSAMADAGRFAVEFRHADAAMEHGHHAPCDQKDQKSAAGHCCVSASGCSLCVPVTMQVLAGVTPSEPVAVAPLSVSSPGDVSMMLRPPKLSVTA